MSHRVLCNVLSFYYSLQTTVFADDISYFTRLIDGDVSLSRGLLYINVQLTCSTRKGVHKLVLFS